MHVSFVLEFVVLTFHCHAESLWNDFFDCEDYLQELGVALKSLCIDDEIDADESDFVIYCCE
jgi:hypothetical protein